MLTLQVGFDFSLCLVHQAGRTGLNGNTVDVFHAKQAAHRSGYRNICGIIRVTETRTALFFQNTDDIKGLTIHTDLFANGIRTVENVLSDIRAKNDDTLEGSHFGLIEEASLCNRMVLNGRIILTGTRYRLSIVFIRILNRGVTVDRRDDSLDSRTVTDDVIGIFKL